MTVAPTIAIDAGPWMRRAVRLAVRGRGRVEPNPMVGCVVLDERGELAGWGFHRRVGGPHAEAEALARAGRRARGGTLVVTLEPCAHHGRTPPCTEAIERAGVARVVYGSRDPHPQAGGGAGRLEARGIEVEQRETDAVRELNAPFLHRVTTGLPWVSAKWAQTIDGAIASRSGRSRWISSERSRAMVHRERGRVDCVLTGIGTVLADDPELTARGVRLRRPALRVIVDPGLQMPVDAKLVRGSMREGAAGPKAPLVVAEPDAIHGDPGRVEALRAAGVEVMPHAGTLADLLRSLASERGVSRVLVESGGGLLGRLLREGLVNECWVVVAPMLAADAEAIRPARGFAPDAITDMQRRRLVGSWRRGDELVNLYR